MADINGDGRPIADPALPIDSLDDLCLLHIATLLPLEALISLSMTCKRMWAKGEASSLWLALLWQHFGVPPISRLGSKRLFRTIKAASEGIFSLERFSSPGKSLCDVFCAHFRYQPLAALSLHSQGASSPATSLRCELS